MANEKDIARIVAQLSAGYPNWNTTPFTLEVYYQDLKDIPADELDIAVRSCRAEIGRKFAPSTGEIRGAVAELHRACNNIPSSYEAWQEVLEQMRRNGGDFGKPIWSHLLVAKTVRALGWVNLRMSEDQTADRARFIQCYEQFQERAEREDLLIPEVRGYIETNGGRMLAPLDQIKILSDRMKK